MPDLPFDCEIVFTGICTLVPNKPWDQSPERICVLLPDGRGDGTKQFVRKAMDGKLDLRRHRGFITFPLHTLCGGDLPADAEGVRYLGRERVTFHSDAEIGTLNPLSVPADPLKRIPDFTKIAPAYAGVEASSLSRNPPLKLLSQVVVESGELCAGAGDHYWKFPGTLSGKESTGNKLTHQVIFFLKKLYRLYIKFQPFDGGPPSTLVLTSGRIGPPLRVVIANFCDDNPLQWSTDRTPRDDEDFAWHYELVPEAQHGRLKVDLGTGKLPYPILGAAGNIGGVNCFTRLASDQDFSV